MESHPLNLVSLYVAMLPQNSSMTTFHNDATEFNIILNFV